MAACYAFIHKTGMLNPSSAKYTLNFESSNSGDEFMLSSPKDSLCNQRNEVKTVYGLQTVTYTKKTRAMKNLIYQSSFY